MITPTRDFVYRPNLVFEPFSPEAADRHDLAEVMDENEGSFIQDRVIGIDAEAKLVHTIDTGDVEYDHLILAMGARMQPSISTAETLWIRPIAKRIEPILDEAARAGGLELIAPAGVIWTLPLYEFALMAARRLQERREQTPIRVFTPESEPLALFGPAAAAEVSDLLAARHIEVHSSCWISERGDGSLEMVGDCPEPGPCRVALPSIEGIRVSGVPADRDGFIPIDQFSRVRGLRDVYAAGDGTDFPVKQGGIATQEADIAAEMISSAINGGPDPQARKLVLRGKLVTGAETLNMRASVGGGAGEGVVSSDYLWWPPHKVSGHYLAPWLAGEVVHRDPAPPDRTTDVEVSLPHEWHPEPMHGVMPGEGL